MPDFLTAPRPASEVPVEKVAAAASSSPAPLRVLLAEDARDNVVLVRAFVRNAGVELDVADNGAAAVERFQADRYDLVLMDIQMPIVDGYTATRQIRAWEAEQHRPRTPIIALSAHALQEEGQQSLDAGCDAHLTKPIRKQTLLDAIDRYARHACERAAALLRIPGMRCPSSGSSRGCGRPSSSAGRTMNGRK